MIGCGATEASGTQKCIELLPCPMLDDTKSTLDFGLIWGRAVVLWGHRSLWNPKNALDSGLIRGRAVVLWGHRSLWNPKNALDFGIIRSWIIVVKPQINFQAKPQGFLVIFHSKLRIFWVLGFCGLTNDSWGFCGLSKNIHQHRTRPKSNAFFLVSEASAASQNDHPASDKTEI